MARTTVRLVSLPFTCFLCCTAISIPHGPMELKSKLGEKAQTMLRDIQEGKPSRKVIKEAAVQALEEGKQHLEKRSQSLEEGPRKTVLAATAQALDKGNQRLQKGPRKVVLDATVQALEKGGQGLEKQGKRLEAMREEQIARKHARREALREVVGQIPAVMTAKIAKSKKVARKPEDSSVVPSAGEVLLVEEPVKPLLERVNVLPALMVKNAAIFSMLLLFVTVAAGILVQHLTKEAPKATGEIVKAKPKPREDVVLGTTLASCFLIVCLWTPVFALAYMAYHGSMAAFVVLAIPISVELTNQAMLLWRKWNNRLVAQDYFFNLKFEREDDPEHSIQLLGKSLLLFDSPEKAQAFSDQIRDVIHDMIYKEKETPLHCYCVGDEFYFEKDLDKAMSDSWRGSTPFEWETSANTAKGLEVAAVVDGCKVTTYMRARHDIMDGVGGFNMVARMYKLKQPAAELPWFMAVMMKMLDKCPLMLYVAPPVSYNFRDTSSAALWPKKHKSYNCEASRDAMKKIAATFGCSDAIYAYAAVCQAYIQTNGTDLDIAFIWFTKVTDTARNHGSGVSLHIPKESSLEDIVDRLHWLKKNPMTLLQASAAAYISNRTHMFGKSAPNMPFPKIDILFSSVPVSSENNETIEAWKEVNLDLKLRRPMIAYMLGVSNRFLFSFVHDPERVPTEPFAENLQLVLPHSLFPGKTAASF